MTFHVQKKIAALVALLCSLISASQLIYLLINLHSTFYYWGSQRLAQIFASSKQRRRIRVRRRPDPARKASAWVKPRKYLGWSSKHFWGLVKVLTFSNGYVKVREVQCSKWAVHHQRRVRRAVTGLSQNNYPTRLCRKFPVSCAGTF